MKFIKETVLFASLALVFAGCHTIHPLSIPENAIVSEVPALQKKIGLVLDNEYRTYINKDRGNPLADPQKYLVGEALAPLTEHYFKRAALELTTYDSLEAARKDSTIAKYDYIIYPKIKEFDNTIRLTEQRIDVVLGAGIYKPDSTLVKDVEARAMANEGQDPKKIVSTALQLALSRLIREVKKEVAS